MHFPYLHTQNFNVKIKNYPNYSFDLDVVIFFLSGITHHSLVGI